MHTAVWIVVTLVFAFMFPVASEAQTGGAFSIATGFATTDVGPDKGETTFPVIDFGAGYTYGGLQGENVGFSLGFGFFFDTHPIKLQSGRETKVFNVFEGGINGTVNLRVKNISGGLLMDLRRIERGYNEEADVDLGELNQLVGFGFGLRGDVERTAVQFNWLNYAEDDGVVDMDASFAETAPLDKGRLWRVTVAHFLTNNTAVKFDYTDKSFTFDRVGINSSGAFDHKGRLVTFGILWAFAG